MSKKIFVDPKIKKLVSDLNTFLQFRWSEDIPKPSKFVIYGMYGSQKKEALCTTLSENDFTYKVYDLRLAKSWKRRTLARDAIIILEHGDLLPSMYSVLKNYFQEKTIIVLNDVQPYGKNDNAEFWLNEFDRKIICSSPTSEFLKNTFKELIHMFGQQYRCKVKLTEEDYEELTVASENCMYEDVVRFCKKMFYDMVLIPQKKRILDFDRIKSKYLFTIENTSVHSILRDLPYLMPKRRQVYEYTKYEIKRI